MPKRKASFAFASGSPAKLAKRSTSASITALQTRSSVGRPAFTPVVLSPSPTRTTEFAPISPFEDNDPLPALRRNATLPPPSETLTSGSSAKSSTRSKTQSLSKEDKSIFAQRSLMTHTKSGSVGGYDADDERGSMYRRKSSRVKYSLSEKKMPSGMTHLVLPGSIMNLTKPASVSSMSKSLPQTLLIKQNSRLSISRGASQTSLSKSDSKSSKVSKTSSLSSISQPQSRTSLSSTPSFSRDLTRTNSSNYSPKSSEISKAASVRSGDAFKHFVNNETPKDESMKEPMAGRSHDGPSVSGLLPQSDLLEVVLAFDTTMSAMHKHIEELKTNGKALIKKLQAEFPGIRIAIITNMDANEELDNYAVKWLDLTTSETDLCNMIELTKPTNDGDTKGCYERVLKITRESLSWTPGSKRSLIVVCDCSPTDPGYKVDGAINNALRTCCSALRDLDVRVYIVFAGKFPNSKQFIGSIPKLTGGVNACVYNLEGAFDVVMKICYREGGNTDMLKELFYWAKVEEMASRIDKNRLDSSGGKIVTKVSQKRASIARTAGKMNASRYGTRRKLEIISTKANSNRKQNTNSKAAKMEIAKMDKKRKDKRQLREKSIKGSFCIGPLKKIDWSKWSTCVVQKTVSSEKKKGFRQIASRQGMRATSMFGDDFSKPSIYEVAVRSPRNSKMYPVYYKATHGFTTTSLYKFLFGPVLILKEVEEAISQGLVVSVRRGIPKYKSVVANEKAVDEIRKYMDENFDYAWKTYPWRKALHRSLEFIRKRQKPGNHIA